MENLLSAKAKSLTVEKEADFFKNFKDEYVDFFVNLCKSYDDTLFEDEAGYAGESIYASFFLKGYRGRNLHAGFLCNMKKNGTDIGYIFAKLNLYVIENFLYAHKDNSECKIYIYDLTLLLKEYTNEVENLCVAKKDKAVHIDFDHLTTSDAAFNYFEVFENLKNKNYSVKLLNLYKGIPILSNADILDAANKNKADPLQLIAMDSEKAAFVIKDENLSDYLKAEIEFSNFKNNNVVLKNFKKLESMPAFDRRYVRVHPNMYAEVSLLDEDMKTMGHLYDISVDGIGVLSDYNNGIQKDSNIKALFDITFPLSNNTKRIECEGAVLAIIRNQDSFRYCLQIHPDNETKDILIDFVHEREREIMNELQDELEKCSI